MKIDLFWFTINALAVYRLSRLVTTDVITRGLRNRIVKLNNQFLTDLIGCNWCTSMWIAAFVVILMVALPTIWLYPAVLLAFSAVAGFLSEKELG